jgi:cytidylate kinase
MRLITVSREYGAGGGEVARRLAEVLGWELLDHELLHRAARLEHLPDSELEALDEQAISLSDRFRLHPPHQKYIHGLAEAARQAAPQGNVILVGRGSRQWVGANPEAFHLWLVAPRDCRVRRMATIEDQPPEQVAARCFQVDRAREQFTRYFFGPTATELAVGRGPRPRGGCHRPVRPERRSQSRRHRPVRTLADCPVLPREHERPGQRALPLLRADRQVTVRIGSGSVAWRRDTG